VSKRTFYTSAHQPVRSLATNVYLCRLPPQVPTNVNLHVYYPRRYPNAPSAGLRTKPSIVLLLTHSYTSLIHNTPPMSTHATPAGVQRPILHVRAPSRPSSATNVTNIYIRRLPLLVLLRVYILFPQASKPLLYVRAPSGPVFSY